MPFHTVVSQDTSQHSTCDQLAVKETTLRGREGGREGEREGGRERKGGRERDGGREGWREEGEREGVRDEEKYKNTRKMVKVGS